MLFRLSVIPTKEESHYEVLIVRFLPLVEMTKSNEGNYFSYL